MAEYIKNPIERGKENRRMVFCFFKDNPCSTNIDAAIALDMSVMTIGKHAKAIRNGWKPEEVQADA